MHSRQVAVSFFSLQNSVLYINHLDIMCSVDSLCVLCPFNIACTLYSTIQVTVLKYTRCSALKDTMQLRRETESLCDCVWYLYSAVGRHESLCVVKPCFRRNCILSSFRQCWLSQIRTYQGPRQRWNRLYLFWGVSLKSKEWTHCVLCFFRVFEYLDKIRWP